MNIFRKPAENIRVSLKSVCNKGYSTRKPLYIYETVAKFFLE